MSILAADEMDDPLVHEDLGVLSIVPSRKMNERVTKVTSVAIETDELFECHVQTNTDYEIIHMEVQTEDFEAQPQYDEEGNIIPGTDNNVGTSTVPLPNFEIGMNDIFDNNNMLYNLKTDFELSDHPAADEDEEQTADDIADQFADYNRTELVSQSNAKNATIDKEENKSLGFDVTSVSWAWNGRTIAVSYGKQNHPSMSFQGWISIWGIFRRDMDTKKPSKNIEVSNWVTSLKFHPSDPNLLAGGTFIGEIYLWNVFNDDPEICCSRADEYYHRESVTQLVWVSQQHIGSLNYMYNLVSTSTDGKILVWNPENKLSYPIRGYLMARKKKGELSIVGGTALDVNCKDINSFIVGTEGGSIFKCNIPLATFSSQINVASNFEGLQKKLRWKKEAEDVINTIPKKTNMEKVKQEVERYWMDRGFKEVEPVHIFNAKPEIHCLFSTPFNLSYEKQFGPCQSISCSPFHRKIFLACSVDGTVKMYDMINTRSIASFEPSDNEYLMDVCFSPIRPAVFAVIGTKGIPYIYDLTVSRQVPAFTLEEESDEKTAFKRPGCVKISFNPKQRDFVAVGYMEGTTKIYKLNQSLSNPQPNEINALDEMLEDATE